MALTAPLPAAEQRLRQQRSEFEDGIAFFEACKETLRDAPEEPSTLRSRASYCESSDDDDETEVARCPFLAGSAAGALRAQGRLRSRRSTEPVPPPADARKKSVHQDHRRYRAC